MGTDIHLTALLRALALAPPQRSLREGQLLLGFSEFLLDLLFVHHLRERRPRNQLGRTRVGSGARCPSLPRCWPPPCPPSATRPEASVGSGVSNSQQGGCLHTHLVLFSGVACRCARGRLARPLLGSTLAALLVPVLLLEVVVRAQLPRKVLVQRLGPKPAAANSAMSRATSGVGTGRRRTSGSGCRPRSGTARPAAALARGTRSAPAGTASRTSGTAR